MTLIESFQFKYQVYGIRFGMNHRVPAWCAYNMLLHILCSTWHKSIIAYSGVQFLLFYRQLSTILGIFVFYDWRISHHQTKLCFAFLPIIRYFWRLRSNTNFMGNLFGRASVPRPPRTEKRQQKSVHSVPAPKRLQRVLPEARRYRGSIQITTYVEAVGYSLCYPKTR